MLSGNGGNNFLKGEAGQDFIFGKGGNDTLAGGAGSDALEGGAGADTFEFEETYRDIDTISDFQINVDKIDLSAIDANTGIADNQAFISFGISFTNRAGELILDPRNHLRLLGDTDGDGNSDFAIEFDAGSGSPHSLFDFVL